MPLSREESRQEAFVKGVKALRAAGIESPALDASILLGHATGVPAASVLLERDATLSSAEGELFEDLIRKRCGRVAVSRLTGCREFYSKTFTITEDVLDPRPETEILVEEAVLFLGREDRRTKVLDVGTGSGAIAVSVASEVPRAAVTATDISMRALAVARGNAARHSVLDRVAFVQSDLLDGIGGHGRFDAVLSNPPYISSAEFESLPDEVRGGDPLMALVSGSSGREFYPRIARRSRVLLGSGGALMVEVGFGQCEAVAGTLERAGFAAVEIVKDLAGRGRVVKGVKRDV